MTSIVDTSTFNDDWEEWEPERMPFWKHMIAGSCAGLMEHSFMFPMDTIKTHMQTYKGAITSEKGVIATFRKVVQGEGFVSLWRGVTAVASGCIPAHAGYFAIYETSKEELGANKQGYHPFAAAASGALATVAHDGILTPMDVVKQRMQLTRSHNLWNTVSYITRTEGYRALFRSYPITLLMNIPNASVLVSANESLKRYLIPNSHDGQFHFFIYFLSGAGAGAIAAAVTNPLDVVKTRLQTQNLHSCHCPVKSPTIKGVGLGAPAQMVAVHTTSTPPTPTAKHVVKYRGIWSTTRTIWLEEGLKGFSRGLVARMLYHTPSASICWGTYEVMKHLLAVSDRK
eukprot:GILK01003947.1.p1 GENE.GILK01003947.1~~GILK01003947.1.p1  ORF type:complete len:384 (-),score=22.98 GILK01003947.1:100-1125(-)